MSLAKVKESLTQ